MDQDECIRFIELYGSMPVLWNAKEKDYHNRNIKENAWRELSKSMGISVPTLKVKMKNLMGTFRSEKSRANKKTTRSDYGCVYVSKWFAYKYFDFLLERDAPKETTNFAIETLDIKTEEPEDEELDAIVEPRLSASIDTISYERTSTESFCGTSPTADTSGYFQTPIDNGAQRSEIDQRSAKRKKVDRDDGTRLLDEKFQPLQSSVDVSNDPYTIYGHHVANELRKYDGRTLAMVKMAFSDIMFKADVGSLFLATDPEPPYFTPDTVLQQSHGGSPSPSEKVPQFWTASPPPPNPTGYSSPGPSLPPPTTCTHPNGKGRASENLLRLRRFVAGTRNVDSNMVDLKEVVSTLNKMAPLSLAESWDNVGLLVEPCVTKPIASVFLANDLTESVMAEAESFNTDLIIVYHPPLFRPFKRINNESWKDRILARCLHLGIAVYSPHTSWDAAENGLSDWLISCFAGKVSPIIPINAKPSYSHVAVFASVPWMMNDTNYTPLDGKQIRAFVQAEVIDLNANRNIRILDDGGSQLQVLCDESMLHELTQVAVSHKLHFHANSNISLPSHTTAGSGRFCRLDYEESIGSIIPRLKKHLGVDNLLVALAEGTTMESTVKTVAAVAGSGESVLEKTKADLFLTGEMSHHNILDATQRKTSVILTNHSNSERGYLKEFARKLLGQIPRLNVNISKVDKDPLEFV